MAAWLENLLRRSIANGQRPPQSHDSSSDIYADS